MYIIPVIVGGVFYMSIFSIFSNIIYYEKKPKYVMGAGVAAAVMNFILNLIFIPLCGYFAAGYTTLASYLLQVVWSYVAVKKVTGESVYDMKNWDDRFDHPGNVYWSPGFIFLYPPSLGIVSGDCGSNLDQTGCSDRRSFA